MMTFPSQTELQKAPSPPYLNPHADRSAARTTIENPEGGRTLRRPVGTMMCYADTRRLHHPFLAGDSSPWSNSWMSCYHGGAEFCVTREF